MLETPTVMRVAQDLARYSGTRQAEIAKNIANADTPGFRARDLESFADTFQRFRQQLDARATRAGHMSASTARPDWQRVEVGGQPSPNGNTVSLEEEMVRATRAQSDHTLALTVYSSSLEILRTALGRGR